MTYRAGLTYRAERDLDHILAWLVERSPAGAAAWLRRWQEVIDELRRKADRCQLAPENDDHDEEIRHVIFKTRRGRKYRALFVIRGEFVLVIHVRGPGQDLVSPNEMQFDES